MSKFSVLNLKKDLQPIDITGTGIEVVNESDHLLRTVARNPVKKYWETKKQTNSSVAFSGTNYQFKINRTENWISNVWFEFNYTTSTTTTSAGQGFQFVSEYRVYLDGTRIQQFKGENLMLMTRDANPDPDDWATIYRLSGGDGSAIADATYTNFIPLLTPGNNNVLDAEQHLFPVGMLKTELMIELDLRAAAAIFNTEGSATINSVTLHYDSWALDGVPFPSTIKFPMIDVDYFSQYQTGTAGIALTSSLSGQIDIDSVFNDKEQIKCLLMITTDENDGNGQRLLGADINALRFTVNGDDIYKWDSINEGLKKFASDNGWSNEFTANSATRYWYSIPFTENNNQYHDMVEEIQSDGLNLNKANVRLQLASTSSGDYILNLIAINKAYIYMDGQSVAKIMYK